MIFRSYEYSVKRIL